MTCGSRRHERPFLPRDGLGESLAPHDEEWPAGVKSVSLSHPSARALQRANHVFRAPFFGDRFPALCQHVPATPGLSRSRRGGATSTAMVGASASSPGCAKSVPRTVYVATKAGRRLSHHTADGYNLANLRAFVEREPPQPRGPGNRSPAAPLPAARSVRTAGGLRRPRPAGRGGRNPLLRRVRRDGRGGEERHPARERAERPDSRSHAAPASAQRARMGFVNAKGRAPGLCRKVIGLLPRAMAMIQSPECSATCAVSSRRTTPSAAGLRMPRCDGLAAAHEVHRRDVDPGRRFDVHVHRDVVAGRDVVADLRVAGAEAHEGPARDDDPPAPHGVDERRARRTLRACRCRPGRSSGARRARGTSSLCESELPVAVTREPGVEQRVPVAQARLDPADVGVVVAVEDLERVERRVEEGGRAGATRRSRPDRGAAARSTRSTPCAGWLTCTTLSRSRGAAARAAAKMSRGVVFA